MDFGLRATDRIRKLLSIVGHGLFMGFDNNNKRNAPLVYFKSRKPTLIT